MLIYGRIIPTPGKPPTPWSLDSDLELSFSLQIEDQGLVEYDLSSWTHLILINLCYTLGYVILLVSSALPPSLLCYALLLSPIQAHNVASTIFWQDE